MFWDDLKVALNFLNIAFRFDINNVLFGILDTDNTNILVNYILLESKYFIYQCKLNKGSLCIRLLVDRFKKTFQTERFIAKKKTIKSMFIIANGNPYSLNATVAVIQTPFF